MKKNLKLLISSALVVLSFLPQQRAWGVENTSISLSNRIVKDEIRGFHYGFHQNMEALRNHAQKLGLEIDSTSTPTVPKVIYPINLPQIRATNIAVQFDLILIVGDVKVGLWNSDRTELLSEEKHFQIQSSRYFSSIVEASRIEEAQIKLVIDSNDPFALDILSLKTVFTFAESNQSRFLREYNSIGQDDQNYFRSQEKLSYPKLQIGDEGVKDIALGIKYNNVIWYADFNHNQITEEGIGYLAHALKNKPILEFYMCGSKIGDQGHIFLAEAIKTWANLTHLDLNCTDLGDIGAEALADALMNKSNLIKFNFNEGNKAVSKLLKVLANRT